MGNIQRALWDVEQNPSQPASRVVGGTSAIVSNQLELTDRNMIMPNGVDALGGFSNKGEVLVGAETVTPTWNEGLN